MVTSVTRGLWQCNRCDVNPWMEAIFPCQTIDRSGHRGYDLDHLRGKRVGIPRTSWPRLQAKLRSRMESSLHRLGASRAGGSRGASPTCVNHHLDSPTTSLPSYFDPRKNRPACLRGNGAYCLTVQECRDWLMLTSRCRARQATPNTSSRRGTFNVCSQSIPKAVKLTHLITCGLAAQCPDGRGAEHV